MLHDCNIEITGLIIETGHWARVESVLSDFLFEKIDNRYFLDLGNGFKFWIDHSKEREDETNSKHFRKTVDEYFLDMDSNEHFKPSEVVNMFGKVAQNQQTTQNKIDHVTQNQVLFDKNHASHVNVVRNMAQNTHSLKKAFDKFNDLLTGNNNIFNKSSSKEYQRDI